MLVSTAPSNTLDQYFFELWNDTKKNVDSHAATGNLYPTVAGEKLWTAFDLSEDYVWTLGMGVVGDPTRTSTVVSAKPFMGLLDLPRIPKANRTSSWRESHYNTCFVNSCWELYGMRDKAHYPSSGSNYDMRITSDTPNAVKWDTRWNARLEWSNCSGAPNATISERHNATVQDVFWDITTAP